VQCSVALRSRRCGWGPRGSRATWSRAVGARVRAAPEAQRLPGARLARGRLRRRPFGECVREVTDGGLRATGCAAAWLPARLGLRPARRLALWWLCSFPGGSRATGVAAARSQAVSGGREPGLFPALARRCPAVGLLVVPCRGAWP